MSRAVRERKNTSGQRPVMKSSIETETRVEFLEARIKHLEDQERISQKKLKLDTEMKKLELESELMFAEMDSIFEKLGLSTIQEKPCTGKVCSITDLERSVAIEEEIQPSDQLRHMNVPHQKDTCTNVINGLDQPEAMGPSELRHEDGAEGEPYDMRSQIVSGPVHGQCGDLDSNFISTDGDRKLKAQEEQFWKLDIGLSLATRSEQHMLRDDKQLVQGHSSIERVDGHYGMDVPFATNLLDIKVMAQKRLECLKSVRNEEETVKLRMLQKSSFKLTKWASNSREVLEHVATEERAERFRSLDLDECMLPVDKVLGIQWNTELDVLNVCVKIKQGNFTRKGLLSSLSSVYDPLGFVAPFIEC